LFFKTRAFRSLPILLLTVLVALAQPPGGGMGGGGMGGGGPPGEGGGPGGGKGGPQGAPLPALFDQGMLDRLKLTDAQKQQVSAFETKQQTEMAGLDQQSKNLETQLIAGSVLLNEPMHEDAVYELLELQRKQMDFKARRIRYFMSILTEEQVKLLQNQYYLEMGF
jgi:Spy/CpxP family protein refolding chaperone